MSRRLASRSVWDERAAVPALRELAAQAFSRAAGAPLVDGTRSRILKDAGENYPAWLEAIRAAKRHVHFESYFIRDDEIGREFADALIAKAGDGVKVRLIYDWLGNFGKASRGFWPGYALQASKCAATIPRSSTVRLPGCLAITARW